jgi:4-hydroxybenzoate polyprenyltransferase
MAVLAHLAAPSPLARVVASVEATPLVVDLDNALLSTDTLVESLFLLLRHQPLALLTLPWHALRGIAHLKRVVAQATATLVTSLPYRAEILAFLETQKTAGRRLVLATGADRLIASRVSTDLGMFETVLSSDGTCNLTGERKRHQLVATFGDKGFDYIGDDERDPVWRSVRKGWLVNPGRGAGARLAGKTELAGTFGASPKLSMYLHELRPSHWVKNGLVFLPLLLAHGFAASQLVRSLSAFLAFSLCASGIYLVNDLFDLSADRAHPTKKNRPLAAGDLPLLHALAMVPLLFTLAAVVALSLSVRFQATVLTYCVVMMLYSLRLKSVPIVDALILAGGYAARVAAGAFAIGVLPSQWLLAFCVCLFLSLALLKRYADLLVKSKTFRSQAQVRGYELHDSVLIAIQGVVSGYLAVMILALYTTTAVLQSKAPAAAGS